MTEWTPQGRERAILILAIIACAALVYIYPLFLPTPLLDPDEGLHALIAQEMVERGDYVVPRIFGEPFQDKPILYSLSQAVSLRLFGMHEWAIRLPGFLFALLGVLTTWIVARRLFNPQVALASSLIAVTMLTPMILAQAAAHDIALVPWTNLVYLCLYNGVARGKQGPSPRTIIAFSAAFALALLAKGLIGVAVVAVGYAAYLTITRQFYIPIVWKYAIGVIGGAALAAPWFLAMENAQPGYLMYYFIIRHFFGYATTSQIHGGEPLYYYLPWVVVGSLPWLCYALAGTFNAWKRRIPEVEFTQKPVLLLACWIVGGLGFLSVASSKLMTYSLPLFPAIAILAGYGWTTYASGRLTEDIRLKLHRAMQGGAYFGMAVPFGLLAVIGWMFETQFPPTAWCAAAAIAIIPAVALKQLRTGHHTRWLTLNGCWVALSVAMALTWPTQEIAKQYSARELAAAINTADELPPQIYLVGDRVASVIFYLTPQRRAELRAGRIAQYPSHALDLWPGLPKNAWFVITDEAKSRSLNPAVRDAPTFQDNAGRFQFISTESPQVTRTAAALR